MTIKSLLLGSAAALAAVSGAQAADAIVAAEPEPMEYVKVCDAYGTGYFYIPGTETCLQITGFIRYRGDYNFNTKAYDGKFDYELYFNAKNDSEYGTVYSLLRFLGNSTNNSSMTGTADGYFGIGGLEIGLFDNQWARFFGYGGHLINGAGYSYGFGSNQYVSYTADLGGAKVVGAIDFIAANKPGYVLAAKGSMGDWTAGLGFAYDSSAKGYTIKGMAQGDVGIANLKLMAFYANKANYYNGSAYKGFSLLASASVAVTDTFAIEASTQWTQSPNQWWIAGGFDWTVASGFRVETEVAYKTSTKTTTGIFRVRRSF
jgi:hypothetical protein